MANPYSSIPDRANGQVIQATWFNTIKENLINNGAVKHNKSATTAPTTSNDDSENYEPGSSWTDTTNDKFYICVDASTGAAVWDEVVSTTSSQTLSNKTLTDPGINGANVNMGTASNTNRIVLPSDTTTNLDALTDTAGLTAYDTTLNEQVYNNGSGWDPLVSKTGTQTLTNKTLTNPAINGANLNLGTPSDTNRILLATDTTANLDLLTDVAGLIAYDTTLSAVVYNDGTGWTAVGTGTGGGGGDINFLSEKLIGDYNTYNDGASSTPVDGTGGTATVVSVAAETVSPIDTTDDILNLKISKSAADGQGEGVSVDFTTRGEIDYASPQVIRISVKSSTNYVDDDFGVYLYDKDNSALVYPTDPDLKASSLVTDQVIEFQTSSDADDYRLILHCKTTNANSYDLTFTVSVGPSKKLIGAPITDWESYAPSVNNCTIGDGTVEGFYRRSGDSGDFFIKFTFGSTTSFTGGSVSFTYPTGLSADTAKYAAIGTNTACEIKDSGTAANRQVGTIRVNEASMQPLTNQSAGITSTTPFTWASGDTITFTVKSVPISGWGTNLQLSNIDNSRPVFFRGRLSSNQSITTSGGDGQKININSITEDSHSGWDATNFWYEIPYTGTYLIKGHVLSSTLSNVWVSGISIDNEGLSGNMWLGNDSNYFRSEISVILNLTKGQTVQLRIRQTESTSETVTGGATENNTHLMIASVGESGRQRLSSEKVVCKYSTNAGQSVTASTYNDVVYEDKILDTHDMYNTSTGVATLPMSGRYYCNATFRYNNATYTAGQGANSIISQNGTTIEQVIEVFEVATTTSRQWTISTIVDGVKGDTIKVETFPAVNTSLSTGSEQNTFKLFKI